MIKNANRFVPILILTAAALLLLIFFTGNSPVRADVLTVNDDGGADYYTIQLALDDASEGDTVLVDAGEYFGNIQVENGVFLIGDEAGGSIINTQGEGVAVTVSADNVSVSNFRFYIGNDGQSRGLHAEDVMNCTFSRLHVYSDAGIFPYGYVLKNVNDSVLNNSYCAEADRAAHLSDCFNVTITDNQFEELTYHALEVYDSSELSITDNLCEQAGEDGIHLERVNLSRIGNNTVEDSGLSGISLTDSHHNVLWENTCRAGGADCSYGMDCAGLRIEFSGENLLDGNILTSNDGYGLFIDRCSGLTLWDNRLDNNGIDFAVEGDIDDNTTFDHRIPENNTANDKPILYISGETGVTIDSPYSTEHCYVVNSVNVSITGINLSQLERGILIAYSEEVNLSECDFFDNEIGCRIYYSHDISLYRCVFSDCEFGGIVATGLENSSISSCTFFGAAAYGIRFVSSSFDCAITENEFSGADLETGILLESSGHCVIGNNLFDALSETGLSLSRSNDNHITGNTFGSMDDTGIHLVRSDDNTITLNTIHGNDVGITVGETGDTGRTGNIIELNDITGNDEYGIDARQNGNQMVNASNNWWGTEDGPSGAGSGSGDPVSTFVIFEPWRRLSSFEKDLTPGPGETGVPVWKKGDRWKWTLTEKASGGRASVVQEVLSTDAQRTDDDETVTCYEISVQVRWFINATLDQGTVYLAVKDLHFVNGQSVMGVHNHLVQMEFPFGVDASWGTGDQFQCYDRKDVSFGDQPYDCYLIIRVRDAGATTIIYSPDTQNILKVETPDHLFEPDVGGAEAADASTSYYTTSNDLFMQPILLMLGGIVLTFVASAVAKRFNGLMTFGLILIIIGGMAGFALIPLSFDNGEDMDAWMEDTPSEGDSMEVAAYIATKEENSGTGGSGTVFSYYLEGSDESLSSNDDVGDEGDFVIIEITVTNGQATVSGEVDSLNYVAPGLICAALGIVIAVVGSRRRRSAFKSGLLYQKMHHINADRLDERIHHSSKAGSKLESPYKRDDEQGIKSLPDIKAAAAESAAQPQGATSQDQQQQATSQPVSQPPAQPSQGSAQPQHVLHTVQQPVQPSTPSVPQSTVPMPQPRQAPVVQQPQPQVNGTQPNGTVPQTASHATTAPTTTGTNGTAQTDPVAPTAQVLNFKCSSCHTSFTLKTDKDEIICPGCGAKYALPG